MICRTKQHLKYHNNSIKILEIAFIPTKVPIKISNRTDFCTKKFTKMPFVCVLFFCFIRIFKTDACYKITYRTQLNRILYMGSSYLMFSNVCIVQHIYEYDYVLIHLTLRVKQ
jgi:hypothetical protein